MNTYKNIESIISDIGFNNYRIEKIRSIYKISSKNKSILLKKFNSKEKIIRTKEFLEKLISTGFVNTQKVSYTDSGLYYFKFNNYYLASFKWIDGKELDFRKTSEVCKCYKMISNYHQHVKNITINIKDSSDFLSQYIQNIKDIEEILKFIKYKNPKTNTDVFFNHYSCSIIKRLYEYIELIDKFKLDAYIQSNKIICHNSLYYQNLILSGDNSFNLIDFGGITLNNRIHDISRFTKRIFLRNKNITELISLYKFNDNEKILFNMLFNYPHKFIKFYKKVYFKQEKLDDIDKILSKLEKYMKFHEDFHYIV